MRAKKIFLVSFAIFALVFSSGCIQDTREPNPELCEKVLQQGNRDICYHRVALAKNDSLFCSKILDLNESDSCYMDLTDGRTNYYMD